MGISSICVEQYCSMSLRIFKSSFLTRFIATPFRPKRPLRPILCRYSSLFIGMSKLMTKDTCCTSRPRPHRSVDMRILELPCLNSSMILSLSFCFMPPCMEETVKLFLIISSESHCTFWILLQKMTAWVMVRLSQRSQRVSNFHYSCSMEMKNCFMPSRLSSSRLTNILMGLFIIYFVISRISQGSVALTTTF